eukprot:gb/GEZN01011653.1/.p1 GENE.gb/GEZN01011653.1/~~gb/GEZN01011653.1/.p1  ORF type:complete len:318 (-),score=50.30 gb/GEZN01011653.1/:73-1026(-)
MRVNKLPWTGKLGLSPRLKSVPKWVGREFFLSGAKSMSRSIGRGCFSSLAKSDSLVALQRLEDGVVILTLNNPSKMNAMTEQMGRQFQAAVELLKLERGLRGVVLTGADPAFSAGGDMSFLLARCKDTQEANVSIMVEFYARFLCLRSLPVPIVSAINGPAVGAGLCVALATDHRAARPGVKLGLNFTQLGLHPGMGATHFLPKLLRPDLATQLLLSGRIFLSEEGVHLGLISDLSDNPLDSALTYIRSLPASSTGLSGTLLTLRQQADVGLQAALVREAEAQAECYAGEQLCKNAENFLAKEKEREKEKGKEKSKR